MKRRLSLALLGLVSASALMAPLCTFAQTEYPDKPIRLVVPYPPGGATDVSARLVATEMGKSLGQSIIVENKPGAAGVVGTDMVVKAAPDGYTLVFGGPGNLTLRPIMDSKVPYDVEKDLIPISHIVTYDHLLLVRKDLPAKNVKEFVEAAKSGKLTYGSSGTGGPQHLAMELFEYMTKTKMTHVPYKGESPALVDLVGGRVDAAILTSAVAGQMIKNGSVRLLAATNPYRSKTFPDAPTVSEAGVPGYEMISYGGLLAPAGTPAPVIEKLEQAAVAAMKVPAIQEQFYKAGLFPIGGTANEFRDLLRSERAKWTPIIKNAGVTLE